MNDIGSKQIETERLLLKVQTMQEQKRLWQILMMPEVSRYFLTVPSKFKEKLFDWKKQEEYYKKCVEHARDSNTFGGAFF